MSNYIDILLYRLVGYLLDQNKRYKKMATPLISKKGTAWRLKSQTVQVLAMVFLFVNVIYAEADEITVINVAGKVESHDSKKDRWSTLKSGFRLIEGDSIRTYPNSSCDIKLGEHIFRLKENSNLELIDIDKEKSIRFGLLSGEILNKLSKLPPESSFSLETPEAVNGVRGTKFLVSRKEEKGTEVYVTEETVHVESKDKKDKSVICGHDQKVEVSPWAWAIYEVWGEGSRETERKEGAEISEEDYIAQFGPGRRIDIFRVAQLDGYRNLAERIYGTVIERDVTLKDYSKDNEIVIKRVEGIVRDAEMVETKFYSNGIIKIRMIVKGNRVVERLKPTVGDIFGTNYLSSPQVTEIKDFDQYIELEDL